MKKKATLADEVAFASGPPLSWKLSKTAIIIIEMPSPSDPHIIGLRRPYLSRKKVGNREPMKNMALMTPPRSSDRLRDMPTLICRTEVM